LIFLFFFLLPITILSYTLFYPYRSFKHSNRSPHKLGLPVIVRWLGDCQRGGVCPGGSLMTYTRAGHSLVSNLNAGSTALAGTSFAQFTSIFHPAT